MLFTQEGLEASINSLRVFHRLKCTQHPIVNSIQVKDLLYVSLIFE